jgi:trans-aconitate methyltransferase
MNTRLSNEKIKDLYDELIPTKYHNNYEFNKWFINEKTRLQYFMTYKSIEYHIRNLEYKNCFELGPGPGTWTKILYRKNPNAKFLLFDISKEMKIQFYLEMRGAENIEYLVGDFLDYKLNYDYYEFFFSSRTLEYINDKISVFKKIFNMLNDNGRGLIITKNPEYKNFLLFNRKEERFQHSGQISHDKFNLLLKSIGFKKIKIYPVAIILPLVQLSSPISKYLWRRNYKNIIKNRILKYIESYIISFEK